MKFITRNSYIMIAMRDLGFARASSTAVGLLISNVFVLSMVKIFSFAVIVIGKAIVVSASIGLALMWMQFDPTFAYDGARPLNGSLFQGVLVGVCAFIVAQIFFYTFQMTIDTILLCFCEDCYQNDGLPARNAALREVLSTNSQKAPVPASIIYAKGNGKLEEFDILIKTDKWTLKDLKKNIVTGNRSNAPGIPAIAELELVIYNKRKRKFDVVAPGKLKKAPIHRIFKVSVDVKAIRIAERERGERERRERNKQKCVSLRQKLDLRTSNYNKAVRYILLYKVYITQYITV